MSIILAMLAGASVFPDIDRHVLDVEARAEAAKSRVAAQPKAVRPPRAMPSVRASLRAKDFPTIVTICGAAANLRDPDEFLTTLGRAYAMPPQEMSALRGACAVYAAGRVRPVAATFTRASW